MLALEQLFSSLCGPLQKNVERSGLHDCIDSRRRADEGVTVGNYRMNRLLFADELVLHEWIFSTGPSAHI